MVTKVFSFDHLGNSLYLGILGARHWVRNSQLARLRALAGYRLQDSFFEKLVDAEQGHVAVGVSVTLCSQDL